MDADDGDVRRGCACPAGCAAARPRRTPSSPLDTVVVFATLRMNSRAARTMPTCTATVRSAKTVRAKVTSQTPMVGPRHLQELRDLPPLAHVVGHHQQDRGQDGERDVPGERGGEQQDGEQGQGVDHPGHRRLAPRTGCSWPCGRWPRSPGCRRRTGRAMLATPWATSSTFGLCLSPLMRSATTADISDSMAPSRATVRAGESRRQDHVRAELRHGRRRAGRWGCRRTGCRSSRPAGRRPPRRPCRAAGRRWSREPA